MQPVDANPRTSPTFGGLGLTIHAVNQAQRINEFLQVPPGRVSILGSGRSTVADFRIADSQISREHVDLHVLPGGVLQVQRRQGSLNRVYLLDDQRHWIDQDHRPFQVRPGQMFAIGSTYFTVEERPTGQLEHDPQPSMSVSISAQELRREMMTSPDRLLQAALVLPVRLTQAGSEEALMCEALQVLRANLPTAELAAVVTLTGERAEIVQHQGRREVHVSTRLVRESAQTGQAVLYQWQGNDSTPVHSLVNQPTWGACLNLGHHDYCLYLGGRSQGTTPHAGEWRPVLRFLEFVGSLLGSMLVSRRQRLQQERLRGFLPQRLRDLFGTLSEDGWQQILRPQLSEITVMFCDLVGFGRLAEEHADDPEPFWRTVQFALDVMTECIHKCDGVVIDFQGDAVLAVWGWPPPGPGVAPDVTQHARQAARAALNIRQRLPDIRNYFDTVFHERMPSPRPQLDCGVALTSGLGLVGFMGNQDFGGIDAFGHTINRAARLQGLTRRFRAPVLIDEGTARCLTTNLPDWCAVHPLVPVWLAGMERSAAAIFQLLPSATPEGEDQGMPTPEELALFRDGTRWPELRSVLEATPPRGFRLFMLEFLRENRFAAPADWDGVFAQRKEH